MAGLCEFTVYFVLVGVTAFYLSVVNCVVDSASFATVVAFEPGQRGFVFRQALVLRQKYFLITSPLRNLFAVDGKKRIIFQDV